MTKQDGLEKNIDLALRLPKVAVRGSFRDVHP